MELRARLTQALADEDWKVKAPKNAFKLICKPNMNLTPQARPKTNGWCLRFRDLRGLMPTWRS